MDAEVVGSTITFVLNSAVMSSFIIPQVQSLKQIKEGLFKHQLAYAPTSGVLTAIAKGEANQQKDAEKLQSVLDMYRIRSEELQATVSKFYWSVLAALATVFTVLVFPGLKTPLLSIHPIIQLAILLWAIKSFATDPDKISSPTYLVRQCEVNIHSLVQALGLSIYMVAEQDTTKITADDPLTINLSMNLRVYGFRFLLFISDEESKVYFMSFGPVTGDTLLWRHMLHPTSYKTEHDRIDIGKFRINSFPAKTFTIRFLLFMPVHPNEELSPMWGSGTQSVDGRGKAILTGTSSIVSISDYGYTYKGVSIQGEGAKISRLNLDDNARGADPVIQAVLRRYRNDLVATKKIVSIEDLNGLIITPINK